MHLSFRAGTPGVGAWVQLIINHLKVDVKPDPIANQTKSGGDKYLPLDTSYQIRMKRYKILTKVTIRFKSDLMSAAQRCRRRLIPLKPPMPKMIFAAGISLFGVGACSTYPRTLPIQHVNQAPSYHPSHISYQVFLPLPAHLTPATTTFL